MPTREEAKQILEERFAHRSTLSMYTDIKFSKGMGMSGPFFQNPAKYDHSLSRPDHRGALRVPAKGFVEGAYFARFPFLKQMDTLPEGSLVSFSQSMFEKAKVPVAAAAPLPKPEKPVLGVSEMKSEVVAEEASVEEVSSDQQSAPEAVKEGRKSKKKK